MEATMLLTAQCKKVLTPSIRLFSICLIFVFWRTDGMVMRVTAKITSVAQCPISKLMVLFHENQCLLNCGCLSLEQDQV
uniref:Putative secreted protein n=1 Tax=Ixodes scapularis TaxID=6945 RepID=A0A4D5RB53_IXOSC